MKNKKKYSKQNNLSVKIPTIAGFAAFMAVALTIYGVAARLGNILLMPDHPRFFGTALLLGFLIGIYIGKIIGFKVGEWLIHKFG
jgi:hypothetical protein